ncbi:MAG: GtrA family protein [Acidobacteriota bacterium]|nr:GtrA family protein [Acidobacteriota bacterium]
MPTSAPATPRTFFAKLTEHIPPGQFGRYLLVGGWNTAFAYGTFALLTHMLENIVPQSYMAASVLSSFLNITVAFLGYKWFVFKTKGNYLREWLRCVGVYSTNIAFGLIALPTVVYILRHTTHLQRSAPYVAGAMLTFVTVLVSFFGHKHYSFKKAAPPSAPEN